MKKDYYDWLEVSKQASPEIIEKAYKTLVKKYHPDLQEESKKKEYEEILKKINEAYNILSNPQKREEYNNLLKVSTQIPNTEKNKQYDKTIISKTNAQNNINERPKKTYEDYKKDFISFILTVFIILTIINIPFVQKIIINFYNNNYAFQHIINIFINLFKIY